MARKYIRISHFFFAAEHNLEYDPKSGYASCGVCKERERVPRTVREAIHKGKSYNGHDYRVHVWSR